MAQDFQGKVIVIFDMWGQRCQTEFIAGISELSPLVWLQRCYEKGWLLPIEIALDNGVVIKDEESLLEMVKDG